MFVCRQINRNAENKVMSKDAKTGKKLSPVEADDLIAILKDRFEKNMDRHKGLKWADVRARLDAAPEKLWPLSEMEHDSEPDVVG